VSSEEIAAADSLVTENAELRRALAVALTESDSWRAVAEQFQADYAMLRAVARKCFDKESTDPNRDMWNLWYLAESDNHPGAALTIRFNRGKAVVEAARCLVTHKNRNECAKIDTALAAYDAPLKEGE
jgi:hypothetical protein